MKQMDISEVSGLGGGLFSNKIVLMAMRQAKKQKTIKEIVIDNTDEGEIVYIVLYKKNSDKDAQALNTLLNSGAIMGINLSSITKGARIQVVKEDKFIKTENMVEVSI